MSSSRDGLAAYRREAAKAEEISQKLMESTDGYEGVVKKSKKAAEQFHSAAKSALSAADDLSKTVGVEKRIAGELLTSADLMTEAVKQTSKAADVYLNTATHLKQEVRVTDREIDKEIAKLPPNSLVTTRSIRTDTDCTTQPTEMQSRSRGRRYQ